MLADRERGHVTQREHLCIVILRTKRGYIQCTERGPLTNREIAEYRRMGYGVIVL